jgi:hypothetical protein
VTELAGSSALASINLPVKNNARTDSLFDQHNYEIANLTYLRATEPEFCQGGCVGIVIRSNR